MAPEAPISFVNISLQVHAMRTIREEQERVSFRGAEDREYGVGDHVCNGVRAPIVNVAHAGTFNYCFNQFFRGEFWIFWFIW
jgi:hypothetical protein